jgi:glycosyltransferase involved in cell wall biosynthesis
VWSHDVQPDGVGRASNALASELGIRDEFVVMYSGNAGLAHRFEEVLDAMDRLRDDPGMEFVFVGGGPRKAEILGRAGAIRNFRYIDYRPRRDLADSLTLADVHLLTLRGDMAGLVVPVKLYGIMAAGRPVVMVGPRGSESGRTIEEAGIGHVIDPDEEGPAAGERLVETLRALRDDPAERRRMGDRAREAFRARFERGVCCDEWERVIRQAIGR